MNMSISLAFLLSVFLLASTWLLRGRHRPKNLPPAPLALPIVGHLHLFGRPLYRSLSELSQRYGPVLYLRFGSRPVLLVSSPSAAEECFTKNDVVFANRPRLVNTKYLHYDHTTLALAHYGPHWSNLRRLTALHVLSTGSVTSSSGVREEEVRSFLRGIFRAGGSDRACSGCFQKVDMRPRLSEMAFNVLMRIISGKRYYGGSAADAAEGERLQRLGDEILRFSTLSAPEDYLPSLGWVSGGDRVRRQMMEVRGRMHKLFQDIIEARREFAASRSYHTEAKGGEAKEPIIDVLLRLQVTDGEYYTDELIQGVIQVLMTAGIDTAWGTLEWAMAFLLNRPESLKKARDEIDAVTGHERLLEASDVWNLPYLHNVIKETLRLYPPGALLLPHESSAECTVGGYDVPPGTILLVNAYAIHRDPKLWTAPEEFRPERFEDGEGGDYKLIPFGSGRRKCPGEGLVTSFMLLALGSMIQCFEWERAGEEMVEIAERFGISLMIKAKPLEALCRPRAAMLSLLSHL